MEQTNNISLPVLDLAGNEVEKVELSNDVFAVTVNEQVMFDAVQVYQANLRQATAKTKKRSEVSGGGIKPWRQKGTGRARAGSSRSPLWRHGGIVFGPTGNQNFKLAQNKKAHNLALKSAFSLKVSDNALVVVKDVNLSSHKTKEMVNVCTTLKLPAKTLFVVADECDELCLAARNIPGLFVTSYDNVSVYDLLYVDSVVATVNAVKKIEEELK